MTNDSNTKNQNKRLTKIIIAAIAALLVIAATVTLILTLGKKPPEPGTQKTEWPEAGVYYFDAGYDEYTLTLNVKDTFALIYKGESLSGSYTLADGALTLDFYAEGKENVSATYADNAVTITYDGASMRFLKKINYTVSFETGGAGAIPQVTVVNGKVISKPEDPVREGYVFVGWYADSEYKSTFAFDSQPVSSDITIYARWSEDTEAGEEYTLRFDPRYEGAESIAPMTTTAGKAFGLPMITREGYLFLGWWISMEKDPERLSYQCTEGLTLDANTTLYALWQKEDTGDKLHDPVINVAPGSVSWGDLGARSYYVKVTGPDGEAVVEETTISTSVNVPFATLAEGEYEITVIANATSGEANNSEARRYYTNKALRSVSRFNVVGSTLIFNTVEHAEKYLISVVCGNPDHNHKDFDNGTSRTFSFANCDMPRGGIRFTVTAVADGYAPSTSEEFVYERVLDKIGNMRVDETTETLYWNEVADAEYYIVSVTCADSTHIHEKINNGTRNYICLKSCPVKGGFVTVSVYPVAKGFAPADASEYKFAKTTLASPEGLVVNGASLTWDPVSGAGGYEVMIDGKTYAANDNSYDLSALLDGVYGSVHEIKVRAKGESGSLYSDTLRVIIGKMGELKYSESTLSWNPTLGADYYEIQIGNGEIVTVRGDSRATVELTCAGVNKLRVRAVSGTSSTDWSEIEVFAHTVIFDTLGGSEIIVQYKAVGDRIDLPTPTKAGYKFAGWYNVPGGPASNGLAYRNEFFAASGSMVLYAHYDPEKYEIVYNYGLGGSAEKQTDYVYYEQNYKLVVPEPYSASGAFGGWFSSSGGKGTQYTDAEGNSLAPWSEMAGAELFAFWIDETLSFTKTQVGGKTGYVVSKGARIVLVSEITIPSTYQGLPVLMIAGNAFKDCTNLKVINFPETVEQVSLIDPFAGCTALEAVNVYGTSGSGSSRYWSEDGVLFENGATSQEGAKIAYMPLAKRGTYRIPAGVSEIPDEAFVNSGLSKIIVPASVTRIGNDAFADCKSLTSIVFEAADGQSEKPLSIGKRVFNGCSMLCSINFPARLSEINLTKYVISGDKIVTEGVDNAFTGCLSLTSITIAAGNKYYKAVDGMIFSKDGGTLYYCPETVAGKITVPDTVHTVAPGAFVGCKDLTEVVISSSVSTVGECAFYGLSISKLTFLGNGFDNVTVGRFAFRFCKELSEIEMKGSRLTVLSEGAFYGCSGIKSFTVPALMKRIEKDAFRDCTGLEAIVFENGGDTLEFGENVFYNCTSLTKIHLPAKVSVIPGIFGGCTSLREVTVDEKSEYFKSIEGVLFTKDETTIIYFPNGKSGTYELPAKVTTIANGVFRGVSGLDTIILPSTLTTIGDEAFKDSNIGKITFKNNSFAGELTIGASAFEKAKGLSEFTIPSNTKVIGDYAFSASNIAINSLPEGLETIGSYAFSHTWGIAGMTVPGSVKRIGDHAFYLSTGLDKVILSEGLLYIGDYAFSQVGDNTKFTSIDIPASVRELGNYAFASGNLSKISFAKDSELEIIGAHAFDSSALSEITVPASVRAIGAYAFANSSVSRVIFEESEISLLSDEENYLIVGVEYVRQTRDYYTGALTTEVEKGHVFTGTASLTSVVFPSRLLELKEGSFENAGAESGLTVDFGERSSLKTIGAECFMDSNLTAITIPASVCNLSPVVEDEYGLTYDRPGIGDRAFYSCESLGSITFEASGIEPLTIGDNAFYGVSVTELKLPARLEPYTRYTGESVNGLSGNVAGLSGAQRLDTITVEAGSANYAASDGVLYNSDLTTLIFCPRAKTGAVTVAATVTSIEDCAFSGCQFLSDITFLEGGSDMMIGKEAFRGCTGIKSLVLPKNLVSLGESAFYGCVSLESLTLSGKLQNFSGSMIENCPSLKNILISDGSEAIFSDGGVIYSADKSTLIYYPVNREDTSYTVIAGVKIIASSAFAANAFLETVILPEGLREIGTGAFGDCPRLTTVNIPATVEIINEGAFRNCTALSSVVFDKGEDIAISIADGAFENCAISNIIIPARLTELGNSVFLDSSLSELVFEEGSRLVTLGDSVFQGTSLVSVVLPDGIISIGNRTFSGCLSLDSVTFGEGLQSIGDTTFGVALDTSTYYPTVIAPASSVKAVYFPASLRTMGSDSFSGCASLIGVSFAEYSQLEKLPAGTFYESSIREFTVPASVLEIESKDESNFDIHGAFEKATHLKRVVFAEGSRISVIGDKSFHGCTALKDIEIPGSVSRIGAAAFKGCCALESITVPATTTELGESVFEECTSLKSIALETGATQLPARMFYNCSSLESIVIPSSVSAVGADIFKQSGLARAEIENGKGGLAVIDGVVYDAALTTLLACLPKNDCTTVNVPATVTAVRAGAFANVNSVRRVIFADGGSAPLVIEAGAFTSCRSLCELILPERLTTIGEDAFMMCYDLTHLTIPSTVTVIADYAFDQCYKLVEVYNKSKLPIRVKDYSYGYVAYYARNVYTPTSGSSIIDIDENGYVSATLTITDKVFNDKTYRYEDVTTTYKYLVGYMGTETELTLPSDFEAFYDYLFYSNDTLRGVVIPEGAGRAAMRYSVFESCDNLSVFVEDATAAEAWGAEWNYGRPVIFGYDGEEHTYTFVTNGADAIDPVRSKYSIDLPTPVHPDDTMIFMGWYDNESFLGTAIKETTYYSAERTTLYAKWISPSDITSGGTSFADAITLGLGQTSTVTIEEGGQKVYFKFTATESGNYHVNLTGMDRLVIEVWDDPEAEAYYYYDYVASYDESIIDQDLSKVWNEGQTYYLVIYLGYSFSFYTGDLQFTLSYEG